MEILFIIYILSIFLWIIDIPYWIINMNMTFEYYGPGPHWGTVRKKMSPGKVCKSCVLLLVLRSIYTV